MNPENWTLETGQFDSTRLPRGETRLLNVGGLFAASRLDFDEDIDQRHGCWSDSGDARGLGQRLRLNLGELFLHLAREPADGAIIEPTRDGPLLRLFHSRHG